MLLDVRVVKRMDFRVLPVILALMCISLLVISSQTSNGSDAFFTPKTKSQLQWFCIGMGVYLFFACMDYHKLRELTWPLYGIMIAALIGLFFTQAASNVHRWYILPIVHIAVQPSELAKLIVVLALSWYLERNRQHATSGRTAFYACLIAGVPFLLIYKQPDLGTASVLWPITLVIFYFGGVRKSVVRTMTVMSAVGIAFILLIFTGVLDHEELRPTMTKVLKDYQYERLNPSTHQLRSSLTSIGVGGVTGTGYRKAEFSSRGWLPASETDAVFPAFAEEYGLLGVVILLVLFYTLIYFGFQVTAVAKDYFGRLLSAGITVYLAMHIITNIAMMCGFLPITGVPLVLVTYGGSSVLATMAALGTLQSIFSRRFMF